MYAFSIDIHVITWYTVLQKGGERGMEEKINKLAKVIRALVQLVLEIGTLLAVIKMIIESL